MKRKLCLSTILVLCAIVVFSQPAKPPGKPKYNPEVPMKPVSLDEKVSIGLKKYEHKSANGRVEMSYEKGRRENDGIKPPEISVSTAAMCLTREEVKGQKIENLQAIADSKLMPKIVPGAIIDADVLLKSGFLKYVMMDKRKTIPLVISSNLVKKNTAKVSVGPNKDISNELSATVHSLTRPSNLISKVAMPNLSSTNDLSVSTLVEKIGMDIGASFFYLGSSVKEKFKFSSSKYRYMYVYKFEQVCFPVSYDGVISTENLFTEAVQAKPEWLFVQEVQFGRRLYVLIESECDMESYSSRLKGNLELGAVSAELGVNVKGNSLSKKVKINVIADGGSPFNLTDPTKLEKELTDYFNSSFREMDIVPLSYKLTYLDGEPVSLVSNAFLDGKNCLDNNRMKIRVSKVECVKVDDNKQTEEIYGTASVYYYNTDNKMVYPDGKTLMPIPPGLNMKLPVTTFAFGTKEAPLVMKQGEHNTKAFTTTQQGKYIDVTLSNLDMRIEIKPTVHEKDNVFNADDDYITEDRMSKTFREILLTGATTPVFEFRRKNSIIRVHFEISPI